MVSALLPTPLGPLRAVATGRGLVSLRFDAGPPPEALRDDGAFSDLRAWLGAYFAGGRDPYPGPLAAAATPFQRAVWDRLMTIPHGETRSYGHLARAVGQPMGAQAVGAANGQNPLALVVPCHRVVGADGSLTGYAGGLRRKRALLELESRQRRLF